VSQTNGRNAYGMPLNNTPTRWMTWIVVSALCILCVRASELVPSPRPTTLGVTAFVGARVYPSPTEPPIDDATVPAVWTKIQALRVRSP